MNCERCGQRLFHERDLDGTPELVCINGHRMHGRPPELLADLAAEMGRLRDERGRLRQPSHGGILLG